MLYLIEFVAIGVAILGVFVGLSRLLEGRSENVARQAAGLLLPPLFFLIAYNLDSAGTAAAFFGSGAPYRSLVFGSVMGLLFYAPMRLEREWAKSATLPLAGSMLVSSAVTIGILADGRTMLFFASAALLVFLLLVLFFGLRRTGS